MTPTLFIAFYLVVGILVLGAFDCVDEWLQDMRTNPKVSHVCTAILALAFWPMVVLMTTMDSY